MRIIIDLNANEYNKFKQKQGEKTYREILLGAVGIDAEKRRIGRPSMDEVTKNLEAFHAKVREADAEAMREKLKEVNEANKNNRKKIDDLFAETMKKIKRE